MKKALVLSVMTLLLAACGSQQAEPKTATAESPKDANGDYAKATVLVLDGKINDITLDETSQGKSKVELGTEGYNMKEASKIGKHWHEQVEFLENYIIKNGLDKVELDNKGYAKNDDVLAGCTINIGNMIETAKTAEANALKQE